MSQITLHNPPLALTEHASLNLAPLILLDPVILRERKSQLAEEANYVRSEMNSPLYGERLLTSLFFFLLVSLSPSLSLSPSFSSSPLKFENGDCRVVSANSSDGATTGRATRRDRKWGNDGSGGVGKNVAIKI